MAVNLGDADVYVESFIIDNEDWLEAEDTKKQRILNVADRTLRTEFPNHTIPDDAVYEFCAGLATVFNDTNRLQQHGVASFSVTGVASFTFKENNVKTPGGMALSAFISREVYDIINEAEENEDLPKLGSRSVKWTVM
jgi:hypothetical protein